MPHQLRRHAPASQSQISTCLKYTHIVCHSPALSLTRSDLVQEAICCRSRKSVAESAERKHSRVEQACMRLDVKREEELCRLRVEFFEWWKGWVGISEGWVSQGCWLKVVAASSKPDYYQWIARISQVS